MFSPLCAPRLRPRPARPACPPAPSLLAASWRAPHGLSARGKRNRGGVCWSTCATSASLVRFPASYCRLRRWHSLFFALPPFTCPCPKPNANGCRRRGAGCEGALGAAPGPPLLPPHPTVLTPTTCKPYRSSHERPPAAPIPATPAPHAPPPRARWLSLSPYRTLTAPDMRKPTCGPALTSSAPPPPSLPSLPAAASSSRSRAWWPWTGPTGPRPRTATSRCRSRARWRASRSGTSATTRTAPRTTPSAAPPTRRSSPTRCAVHAVLRRSA